MKKMIFFLASCSTICCYAQVSQQFRDSINKLNNEDHQHMMQQLGITSIRPGANGSNPNAPNAVNYDEAKANPYPVLPDPLRFKNGKIVTIAADWKKRRKEIVEDFDREILGRVPAHTPKVKWQVIRSTDTILGGIAAVQQQLIGQVDNNHYPSVAVNIQMTLVVPATITKKIPVIMELAFVFPPGFRRPGDTTTVVIPAPVPEWQLGCLKRGWGFAILVPVSIQADNGAGLTSGIIGLINKGARRKPDDWGSLRAWAWGASRALDYLETDQRIDGKRIAIEGHSRYGKAALVTMAYDTRFAIAFISSSGEGGAKLHRRNAGEIVENVAAPGEYHWVAGNFIRYAGPLNWNDLPVDAHELIALCAPRPVFISSGDKGDSWVDPKGMFMAAAAAGPVYKLLGKKDLGTSIFPPLETGLMDGEISFRQHSGGHTPGPNWPTFFAYAERYFNQ